MTTEWTDLPTLQDVAKAQADGWEIEVMTWKDWCSWVAGSWDKNWKFRARPPKPKAKMTKFLGWMSEGGLLVEIDEAMCTSSRVEHYRRVPSRDFEAEVLEE